MIHMQLCVPNVLKNINVKVSNLISWTNETRNIKWHETFNHKCRLDASVCNNKQCLNKDKCRYQCKKLIDTGICNKGFIWNPSNCDLEYEESCYVREHLHYESCKCRNK